MTFDRVEQTGLGVAFAGHVLLFGILSAGYFAINPPQPIERQPIEVALVDEVGLESGAPEISTEAPAPKLAEVDAPIEPMPPAPPEPEPVAKAAPQPKPAIKPAPKTETKASPAKQKPAAAGGRLRGLLRGLSDEDSASTSTKAPAATMSSAVQSSLAGAVRRQIKPHWVGPTGADVELLRTILEVRLAKDGSLIGDPRLVDQTGINASNRAQAQLHRERAMRAVRLAAPFQLPAQYYEGWKSMKVTFDWRLSQ
jgi:hypothetical protein